MCQDWLLKAVIKWVVLCWLICRLTFCMYIQNSVRFHLNCTAHLVCWCGSASFFIRPRFNTPSGHSCPWNLHKAWSTCSERLKYRYFKPALEAATNKLDKYYEKTADSPAYIMAMCSFLYLLLILIWEFSMQCLIYQAKWHTSRRIGWRTCTVMSFPQWKRL
jgi:hypothetical protein